VKKLLILTDWFAPGYKAGGPIQSCFNICTALNKQYNIFVLTTDTDHGESNPYPGIVANQWIADPSLNVSVYYLERKTISAKKIKEQVVLINADTVYLNHLFSPLFVVYPLWLKFWGIIKNHMVVCPRGALYESALDLKRYKKMPLLFVYKKMGIHKKVTFHATNQREKKAIESYFPGSEIIEADNLPNTRQPAFRSVRKEPGTLHCIFIARIVPIKNLLFLLNALRQVEYTIKLTIVGPAENVAYWNQCKNVIKELPANITINYIGAQPNTELNALIQENHLFILPTTGENFGHAIFESFLAGRPVLISDQTPWLQLEREKAGWDLPLQNPGIFSDAINTAATYNQQQYDEYAKGAWDYAANYISTKLSREQYFKLFG
jgi:glycosyltransferase involved in cell wall biosynthesis